MCLKARRHAGFSVLGSVDRIVLAVDRNCLGEALHSFSARYVQSADPHLHRLGAYPSQTLKPVFRPSTEGIKKPRP